MFFFKTIMIVGVILFSNIASGRIPTVAFKGITQHFNANKEYYSPTYGMILLEKHIIENLRFYGNFEPGDEETNTGLRRVYIKDNSGDPLWNIVKILFPSSAGGLTVQTPADGNFGRYATPKRVAILLNYANTIRKQYEKSFHILPGAGPETTTTCTTTPLKKIKQKPTSSKESLEDRTVRSILEGITNPHKRLRETLKNLLTDIQNSIAQEGEEIYPKYFTEHVILAFFCERFNEKKDIQEFLRNLDDTIIPDKSKLDDSWEKDLWKKQDLDRIATTNAAKNIDDYYLLNHYDIFYRLIPYDTGEEPIENGLANPYNRSTNTIIIDENFSDCVETAVRHLINLIAYKPNINNEHDKDNENEIINHFIVPKNNQNLMTFIKNKILTMLIMDLPRYATPFIK